MPTPKQGTVQQRDLETLLPQYPRYISVKHFYEDWIGPFCIVLAITAFSAAFNIGACALGRFFLDHFHLWDRRIPSEASSLDKHAELFAAVLASCLSTLVAIGLFVIFIKADDIFKRWKMNFRFLNFPSSLLVLLVLIEWAFLPVSGAIIHPKYQYVNPVSMLGVYWFGHLPLLPLSIPLVWFVYQVLNVDDD
ncbi:hypothetical protein DL96DRAFT_1567776 [Flagelloscypha sp. PMI_526]|nr:hypothetical protein DL96DRAFT_1567776 [Flagelloscypha sp. PMI_526]